MAFSIRKLSKLNFQICFYAWLKTHHHNQISKKPVHSKELGTLVKENSYNSEECETPDGSPRIEFFGQPQAEAEARADLQEEGSLTKVSITKVPHEEEAIGSKRREASGPSISHRPAHPESREIELSTCPRPQSIQRESVSMSISPFRRLAADQNPPEVAQTGKAREVELTIKSARHLPKMDLMGTCDAFCEIEWQGEKHKTTVKKNSYSPDWDETFSFFFDDISASVSELSVVVMDWDMLTKADLVGKVVIPAGTLKAFLQEQNVTQEGSYPVLNEGKTVTGNDKQPCVINLKMCLLVPKEQPLGTATASVQELQEQNQKREMEAARTLAGETQREPEEARWKRELREARRKIEEDQALNEDITEKKRHEEESRKDEARRQEENMRKAAAAKIEEIENAEEAGRAAAAKKEGVDETAGKEDTAAEKAAGPKDAAAAKVVVLAINRMCVCECVCLCVHECLLGNPTINRE
jgi:hypothetical protein